MTWTAPSPAIIDDILSQTRFDANGLISAIAQDPDGTILMLAWMNADALRETLATGRVCYWSRSREKLWRKGKPQASSSSFWRRGWTATWMQPFSSFARPALPATPAGAAVSITALRRTGCKIRCSPKSTLRFFTGAERLRNRKKPDPSPAQERPPGNHSDHAETANRIPSLGRQTVFSDLA